LVGAQVTEALVLEVLEVVAYLALLVVLPLMEEAVEQVF
jgi:hypothetical protein